MVNADDNSQDRQLPLASPKVRFSRLLLVYLICLNLFCRFQTPADKDTISGQIIMPHSGDSTVNRDTNSSSLAPAANLDDSSQNSRPTGPKVCFSV